RRSSDGHDPRGRLQRVPGRGRSRARRAPACEIVGGDRVARRRSRQSHPRDRANRRRQTDRPRRVARASGRAVGALQGPARLRVHGGAVARRRGQDPPFRPARRTPTIQRMSLAQIDFEAFDADNHYYEATDAFTRHLPAEHAKVVQWAEVGGKPRMVVDNKLFRFIPNPTFDPVARPGCLDDYFRGKVAGDDIRAAFGALEPISPAYRHPEARVKLMDTQGMEACFL